MNPCPACGDDDVIFCSRKDCPLMGVRTTAALAAIGVCGAFIVILFCLIGYVRAAHAADDETVELPRATVTRMLEQHQADLATIKRLRDVADLCFARYEGIMR